MDPQNESMGMEVWMRYGIGSMNKARSGSLSGGRFDPIDLCAHGVTGAHGITELVSDLELQSQTISERRSGLLEAPRQNSGSTYRGQHNSLLTAGKAAPKTPAWGPRASGIFLKLPQPSPSSHVAMHGIKGTAPNSVGEDDNHLHTQPHISSGGTS